MMIENNYILLRKEIEKPFKQQNENEEIEHRKITQDELIKKVEYKTERSIKENLSICFNIEKNEWKRKDFKYFAIKEMKIKNINSNVTFEVFEIDKNNYLNIKVEAEQELESVSSMEFIHDKINENNSKFERYYTIINTYDSISKFYCNEIFCKFNHFERIFRKLLFNIYITNYSEDYFNKVPVDEETMNKIKKNIKTPSKNKAIRNRIYNKEFLGVLTK